MVQIESANVTEKLNTLPDYDCMKNSETSLSKPWLFHLKRKYFGNVNFTLVLCEIISRYFTNWKAIIVSVRILQFDTM